LTFACLLLPISFAYLIIHKEYNSWLSCILYTLNLCAIFKEHLNFYQLMTKIF